MIVLLLFYVLWNYGPGGSVRFGSFTLCNLEVLKSTDFELVLDQLKENPFELIPKYHTTTMWISAIDVGFDPHSIHPKTGLFSRGVLMNSLHGLDRRAWDPSPAR